MIVRSCVYPGTFDPITIGHLDLLVRSCDIFDRVYFAMAENRDKSCWFSLEERVAMAKKVTQSTGRENIEVIGFNGLLVNLLRELNVKFVVRGIRAFSDYDYETQIAFVNKHIYEAYETVFLMPKIGQQFISSSVVRNLLLHDGSVKGFVPPEILDDLQTRAEIIKHRV